MKACLTCTSMGYMQGRCKSITGCNTQAASATGSLGASHSINILESSSNPGKQTNGPITTAPLNMSTCANPSTNSSNSTDTCKLQDAYCSLQGSEHALDGLRNVCVLWDPSCCGNTESAPRSYWKDQMSVVTKNKCFVKESPDCTTSNPTGRMSALADFKDWMRGPQCYANSPLILGDSVRIFLSLLHSCHTITSIQTDLSRAYSPFCLKNF